ncbi:surfeit locus protein 6 homolog [Anopheles stephensi]|uniref:SURF6 domain-containing protein n=1 Tax=Anopheles stephensi TaxID=30069 RepID=A0A182Y4A1_ANOST|nr:surfeit locus protein 6 homolog [Anopheles stephensi]
MAKKASVEMLNRLQAINDEMEFYMELFNIPESKVDDDESEYLLDSEEKPKKKVMERTADTEEDKTHRVEVKKNKITAKHMGRKSKATTDPQKAERKKLKKEKQMKKKLKTINAKAIKQEQERSKLIEHKPLEEKKEKKPGPMFNAEGKIVFSKVQLDENDVQKKGIETDTKKLLKKVIDNKKQLAELKESGDMEKYAEIKKKQAWEKALAKTAGQKVRDDPELLTKKLTQRKKQIKKSRETWKERQQKIEHQQNQRQKERTANIKERAQKKKNTKLKRMAKKGRVIPGF